MSKYIIKGDILSSVSPLVINTIKNGFIQVNDNIITGVYDTLPDRLQDFEQYTFLDFHDKLIIPGLVDLHVHASQNDFRGTGMDLELLNWLNQNAFNEEAKFADLNYAKSAYSNFVEELKYSGTTRASIFATVHQDATNILMDLLEESGIISYVGKVNMDRNAPVSIMDKSVEDSISQTVRLIENSKKYSRTKPILTPRFTPSCTDELLNELMKLQERFDLPVQSHLSENLDEIELVKNLVKDLPFYGESYNRYGLFGKSKQGKKVPTIMAHCVWSCDLEAKLMADNGVFVAHSPYSNLNLSSGIAPVRSFLDKGIKVGLASDVAGGHTKSIFSAMVACVQVSKIYWRLIDNTKKPVSFTEAFYLATAGGGEFFGNVGKIQKGYEADLLILDDSIFKTTSKLPLITRLEKFTYLSGDLQNGIIGKFVAGKRIF